MSPEKAKRSYRRRHYVVNPSLQYKFIGVMLLMLLVLTVGAIGSVYLAILITLEAFELTNQPFMVAQFSTVGLLVTFELLLIAPFVVWIGVRLTHKVAGPLVRINAALQQLANGDYNVQLKLRKGDSLLDVADAINRVAASLRARAHP